MRMGNVWIITIYKFKTSGDEIDKINKNLQEYTQRLMKLSGYPEIRKIVENFVKYTC